MRLGGGGLQDSSLTLAPGVDRPHCEAEGSLRLEAGHAEGGSVAGHVDHAHLRHLAGLHLGLHHGQVEQLAEASVEAGQTGEKEGGLGLVTHRAVTSGVWAS